MLMPVRQRDNTVVVIVAYAKRLPYERSSLESRGSAGGLTCCHHNDLVPLSSITHLPLLVDLEPII